MKICWDNLEKVKFKNGNFYVNGSIKYYHEHCSYCNESYIGKINSRFCSFYCKKRAPITDNQKNKISTTLQGKYHNIYTHNNIPKYDTFAHQLKPVEQCKRNKEDHNILEVKCAYCSKWYIPTYKHVASRRSAIKEIGDSQRFYCSDKCKKECSDIERYIVQHAKQFAKQTKLTARPKIIYYVSNILYCLNCGHKLTLTQIKQQRKYCSFECSCECKQPHTAETKQKQKESALKSPPRSPETCRKISESQLGFKHSEKTKQMWKDKRKGSGNSRWDGYTAYNIPLYDKYAYKLEPIEQCRRNEYDTNILEVQCTTCNIWFVPMLGTIALRIKGLDTGHNLFYCSDYCKHTCTAFNKSAEQLMKIDATRAGIYPIEDPYCDAWNDRKYKKWLKYERDEGKCQNPLCEYRSTRLVLHHINYVKQNCAPLNLITLCGCCHAASNGNRDWHKAFYIEIMRRRQLKGLI